MPTLGKSTIGANSFTPVANEKRVYKNTLPTLARVTALNIYDFTSTSWQTVILNPTVEISSGYVFVGWISDGAGNFKLLLYGDNNSGAPGPKLYESSVLTITSPVTRYDAVGGTLQYISGDTYSDGATDPFGTPNGTDGNVVSVYADYDIVDPLRSFEPIPFQAQGRNL